MPECTLIRHHFCGVPSPELLFLWGCSGSVLWGEVFDLRGALAVASSPAAAIRGGPQIKIRPVVPLSMGETAQDMTDPPGAFQPGVC